MKTEGKSEKIVFTILILTILITPVWLTYMIVTHPPTEKESKIVNETKVYHTYNNITNVKYYNVTDIYYRDNIEFQIPNQYQCSNSAKIRTSNGMSMFPAFYPNKKYWVDEVKFEDITIGDHIIFKNGNDTILHAVVNLYPDRLRTAGYNNPTTDNYWISPNEVLYRECFARSFTSSD